MFGEKGIYGQSIIRVDDANRMILPKYTFAEPGDNLLILNEEEFLSIHSENEIEEKIKRLELELEEASSRNRKAKKKELYILYSSILKKVTCDKQGRITLGDTTNSKEIKCIGAKDYLILEPQHKKTVR